MSEAFQRALVGWFYSLYWDKSRLQNYLISTSVCIRKTGLNMSNILFFFNNLHCLDKMQRQFLEVVQEPRPCPNLSKCWEPPKLSMTSSLSCLSEIPMQGGTTLENRLKDFKIKGCPWDPSRRESTADAHWEKPRTWLFTLVRQAEDLLRMVDGFT